MQYYELLFVFFEVYLGLQLKYFCVLYLSGNEMLVEVEEVMFVCYVECVSLVDGQCILDLGCGWGLLLLWMVKCYFNVCIVVLFNLCGQCSWIEVWVVECGLMNFSVYIGNIVDFDFVDMFVGGCFDCVVLIEMFEYMKNYGLLLGKIVCWM